MTHAGAGRIPAALTHRQQSSDRGPTRVQSLLVALGSGQHLSRNLLRDIPLHLLLLLEAGIEEAPSGQGIRCLGFQQREHEASESLRGGTSSDPAAIGCTSSCHFPIRLARWHPRMAPRRTPLARREKSAPLRRQLRSEHARFDTVQSKLCLHERGMAGWHQISTSGRRDGQCRVHAIAIRHVPDLRRPRIVDCDGRSGDRRRRTRICVAAEIEPARAGIIRLPYCSTGLRRLAPAGKVIQDHLAATKPACGVIRSLRFAQPVGAVYGSELRQANDGVARDANSMRVRFPGVRLDQYGESIALREVTGREARRRYTVSTKPEAGSSVFAAQDGSGSGSEPCAASFAISRSRSSAPLCHRADAPWLIGST